VDFKNTIVIMTSNIGANIIQERMSDAASATSEAVFEQTRNEVMDQLRQFMRPEFLNRVDDIIMFRPLNEEQIAEVVRMQFKQVQRMLQENNITIHISENAVALIARQSYDPQYGARPVKRMMQRELLNTLSRMVLADQVDKTKPITVTERDGKLTFEN
ncbi:MAG: AAA family ATPase, partial [Bacteroidales bacterium]|nr:AAA family ATPase [Bacteroidales bacterium]